MNDPGFYFVHCSEYTRDTWSRTQFDGSEKFHIALPRSGLITVSAPLDFETLNAEGRNYYLLNISASVSSIQCQAILLFHPTLT